MISSMNNTASALKAFSKQMSVSADNIANVHSDNFKKSRAVNIEKENGGVRVSITKDNSPGPLVEDPLSSTGELKEMSNTDIVEEFTNQMMIEHGFKANAKTMETYDEILGTLIDMVG